MPPLRKLVALCGHPTPAARPSIDAVARFLGALAARLPLETPLPPLLLPAQVSFNKIIIAECHICLSSKLSAPPNPFPEQPHHHGLMISGLFVVAVVVAFCAQAAAQATANEQVRASRRLSRRSSNTRALSEATAEAEATAGLGQTLSRRRRPTR